MPTHDIGFDPDKDYLLDPQMKETTFATCDCCGHQIFPGDKIHVAQFFVVCHSCYEELGENIETV